MIIIIVIILVILLYIYSISRQKIVLDLNSPCALLIPIHEKHFDFIYKLINKLHNKIPLYLIFSSKEQLNKFKMKDKIISLIYTQSSNSIVTDKKFYGLQKLIDSKHEYIIVCDAEIDIISENFNINNIMRKINEIFNNKKIYGGEVTKNINKINDIIKISSSVFIDKKDTDKLLQIIKPDKNYIYTWWSDLPVYKKSHLKDFFSKINIKDYNWYHFDNIIYNYYLLLHQNFTLVNVSPILNIYNSSLEIYTTDNNDKLKLLENVKYGFSWISREFFNKNKSFFMKKGTFILYHLDRV